MKSSDLRWIIEREMQNEINRSNGIPTIPQPIIVENTQTGEEEIFF